MTASRRPPSASAAAPREASYSISELASEFALTTRAIRFYEDEGLLAPRRHKQARIDGGRDRTRVKLILRGKRLGLSLVEIREILDLHDAREGDRRQLQRFLEALDHRRAQLEVQRADIDGARRHALRDGQRRRGAGRLARDPALRDLAHEAVRVLVARDVAPAREQAVEPLGHERAVGDRDVGELGAHGRRDADLVGQRDAVAPAAAQHGARTSEAARVAHADLRRRQQHVGVLEAGRMRAEERQVLRHRLVRAHLDGRQVVDVERRVAGLARPHEQGNVVAPRDEGPLEQAAGLAPARHEVGVLLGL